ncbi:ALK and LTK ligand 2b [Pleuronectes platessa]|uniref:ALK and LTK ligand 2b n=1 Tax=Pleuronectes platessa TaxID=8262 RepID=UPI00232A56C0|nr:ALK and LTK ligand 2b [Pleuronectes platessa]
MLLPRPQVLSALLVLLLAAGRCTAAALLRGSSTRAEGRVEGRSMVELVGRPPRARAETRTETRTEATVALGGKESVNRSQHGIENHPRDPRHKEKFITHLTGPLYFNPKCKKHFNRLYHNTRDCTVPLFYRRCARLLTQLANSPRCTER